MLVAPTSLRMAPDSPITSGIRKEPPTSTSSPLETTTSFPLAMAARTSMVAAALLFTAMAASAPVTFFTMSSTIRWRLPLVPDFRSYSRVQYASITSATACDASLLSLARPRLVWSTTPVALSIRLKGFFFFSASMAVILSMISSRLRTLSIVPFRTAVLMSPTASLTVSTINGLGMVS